MKGKEICEQLDLKEVSSGDFKDSTVTGSSTAETLISMCDQGRRPRGPLKLDPKDEEMIDDIYAIMMAANKDGNVDAKFLRRYVKQHLKSSRKGNSVLKELGKGDKVRSRALPTKKVALPKNSGSLAA